MILDNQSIGSKEKQLWECEVFLPYRVQRFPSVPNLDQPPARPKDEDTRSLRDFMLKESDSYLNESIESFRKEAEQPSPPVIIPEAIIPEQIIPKQKAPPKSRPQLPFFGGNIWGMKPWERTQSPDSQDRRDQDLDKALESGSSLEEIFQRNQECLQNADPPSSHQREPSPPQNYRTEEHLDVEHQREPSPPQNYRTEEHLDVEQHPKFGAGPFVGRWKPKSDGNFRRIIVSTYRSTDGKAEERRTVQDGSKEDHTVTRTIGDQKYTVHTRRDASNPDKTTEMFSNMDKKDKNDFENQWSAYPRVHRGPNDGIISGDNKYDKETRHLFENLFEQSFPGFPKK